MKTLVAMTTALFLAGTIAIAQTQKPVEKKETAKTVTVNQQTNKQVAGQNSANVPLKVQTSNQHNVTKAEPSKVPQASTTKAVSTKHHKKVHHINKVNTSVTTPTNPPATKPAPGKEMKQEKVTQTVKK
jgi:hypothetical protein